MAKVNDFARELSEKYGLSLGDASDFVSAMFDVVKEELDGADSSVKIKGFGTFKVSAVGARASVDVNTGERIIIDGRNKISFTPEVLLRDRVNRPFVQFETVVLNDGVDFSEIDEESEEELDSVTETEPQGVQLSSTAPTDQSTDQSTDQPTLSEQPQGVQLSSTAPTSQPTDQSTDHPTLSEQPQGVQLSPTAPTSQPTDQSTDQPTHSEQPQGVQLSSTAPTSQPTGQSTDQPAPAEQLQGVQLSPTASTSQPTDQPAPAEQPQGVQLSPTAPTSQPTDQSANPQSSSETASKAVNTEEHRDMARRLMTPKTETIEDSEESDDKTTATAPEADDEGIVIGGCRQRSPRIMYVLTIASFLILVSLGIGMYFLYQRIEEKNHVIDRLESRLYAQQATAKAVEPQSTVTVKDTVASKDSLHAAELLAAEKAKQHKKDSIVANPTATTPSDYNYDTRVRTGAYIIVGVAKTVTVQPGQTLASISKAYLGEGMECYVEVLNNRHSVKAGEKLKIPQLKLKPRKR